MALRERLASLNPERTVLVNQAPRPAVIVLENELPSSAERAPECFYLHWGVMKTLGVFGAPICAMDCTISYFTHGSVASGVDRGRVLGQLDRELLMICQPPSTPKIDFSQSPSTDLGTSLSWTLPQIEEVKLPTGRTPNQFAHREHEAHLTVFFFPEVASV